MPEFRKQRIERTTETRQSTQESNAALFLKGEADAADRLYEIMGEAGSTAALWTAWGAVWGIIGYLREAGGQGLVDDFFQITSEVATGGLDRVKLVDLKADAP